MLPNQSSQANQPKARDDSYPLQKISLSTGLSAEGEGADQDEGFDQRDDSPAKRQRVVYKQVQGTMPDSTEYITKMRNDPPT